MLSKKVIAAGHICLDVTPDLSSVPEGQFNQLLQPGKMIQTGGVAVRPGGAVANTGLCLQKLGVAVEMIGKIGTDMFGKAIIEVLSQEAPHSVQNMVVDPGAPTGFAIVLNPQGFDRAFLHFHGANDAFYASDLPRDVLQSADLFQFGYPSLMRSIYRGDGGELVSILQRARRAGLTTSLDFSLPDLTSPAAKVDWPMILANSLPYADLFVPSVEELVFLLKRDTFDRLCADDEMPFVEAVTPELLHELSETVLSYGVSAVMIKIGHRGIYLRTGKSAAWKRGGRALEGLGGEWHEREMWKPAYDVKVQGTIGAGDAAIAGFISSILQDQGPEDALIMAAAAGACSVEAADAVSGLGTREDVLARISQGWAEDPLDLSAQGWRKDQANGIWHKQ